MRPPAIRCCLPFLALALLLIAPQAVAMDAAAPRPRRPMRWRKRCRRRRSPNIAASSRQYQRSARGVRAGSRRLLELDCREAARPQRQAARTAQPIGLDDYVLTQPPVYTGPKRPVNPEPRRRAKNRARAQIYSGRRRSPEGRRPSISSLRRSGPRSEVEFKRAYARVAVGGGADARAGGAGLFVRDRRQRQSRHAIGLERLAAGLARDLDRDRLQPVAHHQQRRTARRAGPRIRPRADGKGRAIVRRASARRWITRSRC